MGIFGGLFRGKKRETMLDRVQDVGGKLIVAGYRAIASQNECAPSSKNIRQTDYRNL